MAKILYVLVVPNDQEVTLFQGWCTKLASPEFLSLLASVTVAPFDTGEIFIDQKELISIRSRGAQKNVAAIGSSLIDTIPDIVKGEFCVIITPADYVSQIKKLNFRNKPAPIIATTKDITDAFRIPFHLENPIHFFDTIIYERIQSELAAHSFPTLHKKIRSHYTMTATCPRFGSGCTLANEMIHHSLGLTFNQHRTIRATEIDSFFSAINESTVSLTRLTHKHKSNQNEVIIYAPAIMATFYNINGHSWNQLFRKVKTPGHKDFIKNGLIRNPGYSGIVMPHEMRDPRSLSREPITQTILKERQKELTLTNYSVALLGSNECIPAIRLPNAVNLHLNKLKEIESIYNRSDKKSETIIQKKFKELTEALKSEIGQKLASLISSKFYSCKICSDSPIEWAYLDKLPLMISHEVSKIPMTPGNMLLQQAALGSSKYLSAATLHDILVIRSFSDHDKIKRFLEVGVGAFPLQNGTRVTFVDVSTASELHTALHAYTGAIVIFDCHGGHDGPEGTGWLQIGSERLNSWELFDKARVPPIVLLSACSTAPIGGSHVSVANGFIRSGAYSVVGTFLPVDARKSSAFISRIIYRVDAFLPAIKKLGYDTISWRTLISGFMRMSYASDVLHYFEKICNTITEDDHHRIHTEANYRINLMSSDWYDHLITQVSTASNIDEHEILRRIKEDTPLLETMLYCQQGRPELLQIVL